MKKVIKKLAAIVAAVAMVAGVVLAIPAKDVAAAETTKTIYVKAPEGTTTVAINFWNWTGISDTEGVTHLTTGAFNGWNPGPVVLTADADGCFAVTLKVDAETFVESGNGISVYLDYTDTAEGNKVEVDPQWNNTDKWADVKDDLLGSAADMCLSTDGSVLQAAEVPDHDTGAGDTSVAVFIILAVAALGVIVVAGKKAVRA